MSLKARIETAAVLLLIAAAAVHVEAQSGRLRGKPKAPQHHDDKEPIRLRVEEVLLPVSVRSDLGKLPPNLQRADFILTEDGKRQVINSVMHTAANILFVLDAGGDSTLKNLNINRDLALKIVDSLGEQDQAAIISYADRTNLLSQWTGDKRRAQACARMEIQTRDQVGFLSKPYLCCSGGAPKDRRAAKRGDYLRRC